MTVELFMKIINLNSSSGKDKIKTFISDIFLQIGCFCWFLAYFMYSSIHASPSMHPLRSNTYHLYIHPTIHSSVWDQYNLPSIHTYIHTCIEKYVCTNGNLHSIMNWGTIPTYHPCIQPSIHSCKNF